MKLSRRSEYGLRALQNMAVVYGEGKPVRTRDLAEDNHIPPKFLEQILLQMKHAGFVRSRRGPKGGYFLSHPPEQITLGEVVRVLDGPLAPISCASRTAYEACSCPDADTCGLRMVMVEVRDAIARIVDHTSLADVVKRGKPEQDPSL